MVSVLKQENVFHLELLNFQTLDEINNIFIP